jgi:hypothetical protein
LGQEEKLKWNLVQKLEGKRPLRKPKRRWDNNIKMNKGS